MYFKNILYLQSIFSKHLNGTSKYMSKYKDTVKILGK